MNDQTLRAAVDSAIRRHLVRQSATARPSEPAGHLLPHVSHDRFAIPRGGDDDGPCLIEPALKCVHCGYCQSYGH